MLNGYTLIRVVWPGKRSTRSWEQLNADLTARLCWSDQMIVVDVEVVGMIEEVVEEVDGTNSSPQATNGALSP